MDDTLEIVQVVMAFGIHADARRWDALEALFAPTVEADYTELTGGEPARTTPSHLVRGWKDFLPGFSGTQHLIGTPLVTLAGTSARAEAEVVATHVIRDESLDGRDTWTLGGRYEMRLRKIDGRWKIEGVKLFAVWQSGNPALAREAIRRVRISAERPPAGETGGAPRGRRHA